MSYGIDKYRASVIRAITLLGFCSAIIIGCSDYEAPVQSSSASHMSDFVRDCGAVAQSTIPDYVTRDPHVWLPDVNFVTPADLKKNPQAYDGQRVGIIGKPAIISLSCDGWNWRDPMCGQDCIAGFGIADGGIALIELSGADGEPWICSGNNCNLYDNCYPMSPNNFSVDYWLVGMVYDYTIYSDRPWFRMHVEQYGVLP